MATAYLADTPERVRRRVEEMENMELPSLPGYSQDLDSASAMSESSVEHERSFVLPGREQDVPTPHPNRINGLAASTSFGQPNHSFRDSSGSTDTSPFPPRASVGRTPSPLEPIEINTAYTSTPASQQSKSRRSTDVRAASKGHERTRSGTEGLGSSTGTGRERWQTPGELSRSFGAEEILPDVTVDLAELPQPTFDDGGLGQGSYARSVNQAEVSSPNDDRSFSPLVEQTPLTRRLSKSHVLINRPGRRSGSNTFQPIKMVHDDAPQVPSPITEVSTPASVQTVIHAPIEQERIPSLTRTEASEQDTSRGATTPEGPPRIIQPGVLIPRQTGEGSDYVLEGEEGDEWSHRTDERENRGQDDEGAGTPTSYRYTVSPDKASQAGTPRRYETPGPEDSFQTASADSPGGALLRNIAAAAVQSPISVPYTPCPPGMANKSSDTNSTPRAALSDAERRKNHVLAVLSSTGIPNRVHRTSIGATPHPLRRVMNATGSDDESSPYRSQTLHAATPSPRAVSAMDVTSTSQHMNESFISVASSADLTSDKRASRLHTGRTSWVNTSVPNLLLPNASAMSSGSLKGLSDHRVDGVKIHKHLNAMNKQLLETNGDLAREAEAWRDEAYRLKAALRDHGIEVEEIDVMGAVRAEVSIEERANRSRNRSHSAGVGDAYGNSVDAISQGAQSAMLQDMAERLDELATGMDEKDQRIAELENQLAEQPAPSASNASFGRQLEDMGRQLEESEEARVEMQADFAKRTAEHAAKFGDICSAFEEQVKDLEVELLQVKGDAQKLKDDKTRLEDLLNAGSTGGKDKEWKRQISGLELDLRRVQDEAKARTDELNELKQHKPDNHALNEVLEQLDSLEQDLADAQEKQQLVEAERDELRARLEAKEGVDITDLRQTVDQQAEELESQQADLKMMFETEQALRAQLVTLANRSSTEDKIRELASELDRVHQLLEQRTDDLAEKEGKIAELEVALEAANARSSTTAVTDHSVVGGLQDRLDEAYHEIGRLKQEMAATPHFKSGLDIRDARIKALEREKAALSDRLAATRASGSPSASLVQSAGSPFKTTPLVHKAIAGLRDPKTPGPMREVSWLQSTIGNADEPILKAQIDYLQRELNNANQQLDTNFDRLEAAGFGGLELAEKLAAAQDRIAELEEQIRTLSQRTHAATALATAQRTASDHDGEKRVQRALESVNKEMEKLKGDMGLERKRLSKDNDRLRDLVENVRVKAEADAARLVSEMERLAQTSEKEMRETEKGMMSAARERDRLKKELQGSVATIKSLERKLKEAPQQHQPAATETVRQLETTVREAVSSAERLRSQLDDKKAELLGAQTTITKLRSERQVIIDNLETFEQDLEQHRKDSRDFGIELQKLRAEKASGGPKRDAEIGRLERDCRVLQRRLEDAEVDAKEQQNKLWGLQKWREDHVCDVASEVSADQSEHLRTQAKELGSQIRYLKAKYVRENTFRLGLSLQKTYLLLMVGGMSQSQQATVKMLADMGHPRVRSDTGKPQYPSFKSVAIAVRSLIRARKAANMWREQVLAREETQRAFHDRRRIASSRGH